MNRTAAQSARFCRAFSLIEATISVVIVSVLLMGALYMAGSAARAQQSLVKRTTAPMVADDLLNEILQCYYEEPIDTPSFGLEPGELLPGQDRSNYDDIDDYHNLSEPTPRDSAGVPISEYEDWVRTVVVERVLILTPNTTSVTDTGLRRITVTATSNTGEVIVRQALRSAFSTFDMHPTEDTEYVVKTTIKLRMSADEDNVRRGTVTHLNRLLAN